MPSKYGKYPNKLDFLPNVDKHSTEFAQFDELPLADPSESNATKVFRTNEAQKIGENEPSAFGQNKNKR